MLRGAAVPLVMLVSPSVCVEQLDFRWTEFCEMWHLGGGFVKFAQKIAVWFNLDRNIRRYT